MRLSWKLYIFLYAFVVALSVVYYLSADSQLILYHKITVSMNKIFCINYYNHYLFIFFEVFSLLPLFLFAFRKRLFSAAFWKLFFMFKVTNALVINYYEHGFYSNLLVITPKFSPIAILISILMILPAYAALFMYAFKTEKLFPSEASV